MMPNPARRVEKTETGGNVETFEIFLRCRREKPDDGDDGRQYARLVDNRTDTGIVPTDPPCPIRA